MANHWKHWCPSGCGKKAYFCENGRSTVKKAYYCPVCEHKFTKTQIERY